MTENRKATIIMIAIAAVSLLVIIGISKQESKARAEGYESGYSVGYDDGYNDGIAHAIEEGID